MTGTQIKIVLDLVDATVNDVATFRAEMFEVDPDDGSLTCIDIYESTSIDVLRELVARCHDVTHVSRNVLPGGWSDALRSLKRSLHAQAVEAGADVRLNSTPVALVQARIAAHKAREERERLDAERDAAEKRDAADRELRVASRDDFDKWCADVAARYEFGSQMYLFRCTVQWARRAVDDYDELRTRHIEKLTANPCYALQWSDDFVQASATYEVARQVLDLFFEGETAEELTQAVQRELLRRATSSSRSTSAMSNLVEECTRTAWAKTLERLTSRW